MTEPIAPAFRLSPAGWEHKQRCRGLPPLAVGDAERLIAEFLVARGVTQCPPRYSVSVEPTSRLTRMSGAMEL